MPRQSTITDALVAEVAARRASGECWKSIENDLRQRGETFGRVTFWRFGVSKRLTDCESTPPQCIA